MPPPGQSGASGKSGYSGYSGYSGRVGLQGPFGPQGVAGVSGPQGPSGASGYSGYSGAGGGVVGPDIAISGSLTTGDGSGDTGRVTFAGTSGTAVLTVEANAGGGTFKLPSMLGAHTLATRTEIDALRTELLALIGGSD